MPQLATNVDITDLIPLARNIAKFHIGETAGFPAARGEQDVGKIGDCVIPQTLEYNVKSFISSCLMRKIIRFRPMSRSIATISRR